MCIFIPGTGLENVRAQAMSARPDAPVLPDDPPRRRPLLTPLLRRLTKPLRTTGRSGRSPVPAPGG